MRELDWHLLRELEELSQRMEALLTSAHLAPSSLASPQPLQPPVDVYETPEAVVVEAELPGVGPQEVHVELSGDTLVLSGALGDADQRSGERLLRMERPRGRFLRTVPLPTPVAPPFEATLSRGVLVVRLPKASPAGRQVPITREGA
jgi:HSP20 family protein